MSKKDEQKEQLEEEIISEEILDDENLEQPVEEERDSTAEFEEVKQELEACQEQILRMAAEFDNAKKRLEREREVSLKYAEENILKELLASIDNLERAMEQGKETDNIDSLLEGIEMTLKGLLGTFEKFGVKQVNSIGEQFDPNVHEAVAMEESEEVAENNVLKEFQKGYMYKDRLLRAAKVIVSNRGSS